jgi:arsenite methyltransferase
MLPIHKLIWFEATAKSTPVRVTEPEVMNDAEQVRSYVKAYEWGGPTSALQLHHIKELSLMIRKGDTVVDLACGPGPLLLELAELFPESNFIGVDLAPLMLAHIENEVQLRGLKNVKTQLADIRKLKKSDVNGGADVIISTSALHHLPKISDLEEVFINANSVLNKDGGIFFFDFGLLKSSKTRKALVAELSKVAPSLTVQDYDVSLQASFPVIKVFELAEKYLPKPISTSSSWFIDFFYFIQTPPRCKRSPAIEKKIEKIWKSLSLEIKIEHIMLRLMQS